MKRVLPYGVVCVATGTVVSVARLGLPFLFVASDALTVAGGIGFCFWVLAYFSRSECADTLAYATQMPFFLFGEKVGFLDFKRARREKRGGQTADGGVFCALLFLFGVFFFPFFL